MFIKEYAIPMYHISEDGDRGLYLHHNFSSDDQMICEHWHNSTRSSTDYEAWRDNNVRIAWAFLCLLFLIFVMFSCVPKFSYPAREFGVPTESEFDKRVVTMTVQPHDQSKPCICGDSDDPEDETKGGTCCCCPRLIISRCRSKRAENRAIRPAAAESSASDTSKSCGRENSEQQTRVQAVSADVDERLELAEEGSSVGVGDGIICAICIDRFRVGEKVTQSRMVGGCRHVFHHECILPWAVLGHMDCPLCKTTFWSRGRGSESEILSIFSLRRGAMRRWMAASEIRNSRFCVQHGLTVSS